MLVAACIVTFRCSVVTSLDAVLVFALGYLISSFTHRLNWL